MQLLQLLCRLFSCSLSIEKNFNQSMWCVVSSFFLCFFFAFLFSSSDLKWFFINGCITGRNVVMNLDVTSWQMSHIHSTQYLKQATKIIMEYTIYIYIDLHESSSKIPYPFGMLNKANMVHTCLCIRYTLWEYSMNMYFPWDCVTYFPLCTFHSIYFTLCSFLLLFCFLMAIGLAQEKQSTWKSGHIENSI